MGTLQKKFSNKADGTPTISSNNLLAYADSIDKSYFDVEFDCVLRNSEGIVEVTHFASDLRLEGLLSVLPVEDIQLIEIKLNTENPHDKTSFFNLDIVLSSGIIRLITHWCLWQDMRTYELVRGMLVPLYLAELQDKVMFDGGLILSQIPENVIRTLIDAAAKQYPDQFNESGTNAQEDIKKYIPNLEVAQEIGKDVGKIPTHMAEEAILKQKAWNFQEALAKRPGVNF